MLARINQALQGLNRQVDAVQHIHILFNLLAQGGQVVAGDNGVDAAEEAALSAVVAKRKLAATSNCLLYTSPSPRD